MKRTEIQKRIIPRNWLFGRLSYINNNLKSTVLGSKGSLTPSEIYELTDIFKKLSKIIDNKKVSSEQLKVIIKRKQNEELL